MCDIVLSRVAGSLSTGSPANVNALVGGPRRQVIVSEHYDEFVFVEPSYEFDAILTRGPLRYLVDPKLDETCMHDKDCVVC